MFPLFFILFDFAVKYILSSFKLSLKQHVAEVTESAPMRYFYYRHLLLAVCCLASAID